VEISGESLEEEDFLQDIVNENGVFLALLMHFSKIQGRSFPGGKLLNRANEPLEIIPPSGQTSFWK